MRKIILAMVIGLLLVSFFSTTALGSTIVIEEYTSGDDSSIDAESRWWFAQTFTPQFNAVTNKVKLKLYRHGLPSTVTVSIKYTDDSGFPMGEDLTSGTIDGDKITAAENGQWYDIDLPPYNLSSGIIYAIILRAPLGNVNNAVFWRLSHTGEYPRGQLVYSNDWGKTWKHNPDPEGSLDFMFVVLTDSLPGDVSDDGRVNLSDMVLVTRHWGETGTPGWITEDVNNDGRISLGDLVFIAQNWTW